MDINSDLKQFIENNLHLVHEANGWDAFFSNAEQEFVPPAINSLANFLEKAGIFPIPTMTFIPEGYYWNSVMTSYTTTSNIKQIHFKSFYGSDIEHLHVTGNVNIIHSDAFLGCSSLSHVFIDEGVTHIDDSAFCNCDDLEYIQLPSTLKYIGHHVFNGCSKLARIVYRGSSYSWNNIKNSEFINEGAYIEHIKCDNGVVRILR